MTIAVRDFVIYDQDGGLSRLHCKICGVVIGERTMRPIGLRRLPDGRMIERVLESFSRNHLYCEVKMSFEDGSAHVTHGCKDCLTGLTDPALLVELEQVDMENMGLKSRNSPVLERVEFKVGGGIA